VVPPDFLVPSNPMKISSIWHFRELLMILFFDWFTGKIGRANQGFELGEASICVGDFGHNVCMRV
jgi:hypothetical protein